MSSSFGSKSLYSALSKQVKALNWSSQRLYLSDSGCWEPNIYHHDMHIGINNIISKEAWIKVWNALRLIIIIILLVLYQKWRQTHSEHNTSCKTNETVFL